MQRLLADAEKLSGVKYDISNLGDVYEAIHVIQQDLGLTGVAAYEASETFTGSMGAMKASLENLMSNLALGKSIEEPLKQLTGNARAFILNNMVPMLKQTISGLPKVLEGAINFATQALLDVAGNTGEIVKFVKNFISNLASALLRAAPGLISAGVELARSLFSALVDGDWLDYASTLINRLKTGIEISAKRMLGDQTIVDAIMESVRNGLPKILEAGRDVVCWLVQSITEALPGLLETGVGLVQSILDGITETLPYLLSTGFIIIQDLASGILEAIPQLVTAAGDIVSGLISFIAENAPLILQSGVNLVFSLVEGIVSAFPDIWQSINDAIGGIINTIIEHLPDLIEKGGEIILSIGDGISNMFEHLPELIKSIGQTAWNYFKNIDWQGLGRAVLQLLATAIRVAGEQVPKILLSIGKTALNIFKSIDWAGLGRTIINFLKNGIQNVGSAVWNAIKSIGQTAWNAFRNLSWVQLGSNIISGIVGGLRNAGAAIVNTLMGFARSALNAVKSFLGIRSPSRVFRDVIGKNIPLGIAAGIEAEADTVMKAMDDLARATVTDIDAGLTLTAGTTPGATHGIGSVVINNTINPAPGMDVRALAQAVSDVIQLDIAQNNAVWGTA